MDRQTVHVYQKDQPKKKNQCRLNRPAVSEFENKTFDSQICDM